LGSKDENETNDHDCQHTKSILIENNDEEAQNIKKNSTKLLSDYNFQSEIETTGTINLFICPKKFFLFFIKNFFYKIFFTMLEKKLYLTKLIRQILANRILFDR
jgi:hypothetical protein